MVHNVRCECAKDPHCECSCHGAGHGIKREELNERIGERYLTYALGGEVEKFMRATVGKVMKCLGICDKKITIHEFRGYPHEDGLADAEGKRWWAYVHCNTCKYSTSWKKIGGRIKEAQQQ